MGCRPAASRSRRCIGGCSCRRRARPRRMVIPQSPSRRSRVGGALALPYLQRVMSDVPPSTGASVGRRAAGFAAASDRGRGIRVDADQTGLASNASTFPAASASAYSAIISSISAGPIIACHRGSLQCTTAALQHRSSSLAWRGCGSGQPSRAAVPPSAREPVLQEVVGTDPLRPCYVRIEG